MVKMTASSRSAPGPNAMAPTRPGPFGIVYGSVRGGVARVSEAVGGTAQMRVGLFGMVYARDDGALALRAQRAKREGAAVLGHLGSFAV